MTIYEQIPLAPLTTLRIGGRARWFAEVGAVSELQEAVRFARSNNVPILVLGGGSNLLVADRGFEGLVVRMVGSAVTAESSKESGEITVVAEAGCSWDAFVETAIKNGWYGLENLSGIPGTVGAAPVQNIGAYGVEVSSVISFVEVFDTQTGQLQKLSSAACAFGYRDSVFKHTAGRSFIITRVSFLLQKTYTPNLIYTDLQKYFPSDTQPTAQEVRKAVLAIRKEKFPSLAEQGTAGSFFKNPIISTPELSVLCEHFPEVPVYSQSNGRVKVSLGWILDKVCELKGFRKGHFGLYEKQALVLVHDGKGTADECLEFVAVVRACAREKAGLEIEPEVRYIGFQDYNLNYNAIII